MRMQVTPVNVCGDFLGQMLVELLQPVVEAFFYGIGRSIKFIFGMQPSDTPEYDALFGLAVFAMIGGGLAMI
jgi:hypothetical protein